MPNGTYGGRGRKTKEIGGKLRESFVFLLLDLADITLYIIIKGPPFADFNRQIAYTKFYTECNVSVWSCCKFLWNEEEY